VRTHHAPRRGLLFSLFMLVALVPGPVLAQETTALPDGWIPATVPGFLSEPALLRKLVATSESRANDEREPADGLYVETGNMITGEG
jgi:hypothetical protein